MEHITDMISAIIKELIIQGLMELVRLALSYFVFDSGVHLPPLSLC